MKCLWNIDGLFSRKCRLIRSCSSYIFFISQSFSCIVSTFVFTFSDSSAATQNGGCFPGESKVQLNTGAEIRISDVRLGDRVRSMRSDGKIEYSEVINFMDRDDEAYGLFYTFHTDSGNQITLTAKHLVYVVNQNSTVDFDTVDVAFADTVMEGQYLLLGDKDSITTSAINRITVGTIQGMYAPLTKHGTIIVDDVIASCYAYIDNIYIAHASFAPMRVYYDISQYFPVFNWPTSNSEVVNRNNTKLPTGVHWYAKLLYTVGTKILSRDTLYVH